MRRGCCRGALSFKIGTLKNKGVFSHTIAIATPHITAVDKGG